MSTYQIREKNSQWKGGRVITPHGYVLIRVGKNHPLADVRGYAYEHRIVAEHKIGRRLNIGEIVHHIDGNKQNNSPDNIEIVDGVFSHKFLHRKSLNKRRPGEVNPIISCECGCGQKISKYDTINRPRRFVSGHNMRVKNG
jgi:hypothetical protein